MAIKFRKSSASSLAKQLQQIAHDYMREHQVDTLDPSQVAEWAVRTGRYQRRPPTLVQLCRRELVRALRSEYYQDPQGREVRVMHPARYEQGVLWATIQTAPPEHMRVSLQQRRLGILADVRQHKTDFDSYNDNNHFQTLLPFFDYNFNTDLEELVLPTDYPDEKPEDPEDEDDNEDET